MQIAVFVQFVLFLTTCKDTQQDPPLAVQDTSLKYHGSGQAFHPCGFHATVVWWRSRGSKQDLCRVTPNGRLRHPAAQLGQEYHQHYVYGRKKPVMFKKSLFLDKKNLCLPEQHIVEPEVTVAKDIETLVVG